MLLDAILLSEDLVEELVDGAVGFEDGEAVIHGAGEVGIGKGDAAEGGAAQQFAWGGPRDLLACRGVAFELSEEKTGLGIEISMAPAIEDDRGDIAMGVKASVREHRRELIPKALLVFAEGGGEHFCAASMALLFGGETGISVQNFHGQDDW